MFMGTGESYNWRASSFQRNSQVNNFQQEKNMSVITIPPLVSVGEVIFYFQAEAR